MMKVYGVVTMDLVRSREMDDRSRVQQKLDECINKINNKYREFLAAPIGFTTGDEWQALLYNPSKCYSIIEEFQQYLWTLDILFYAGIGIGELSTEVYKEVNKMDGPCFHMAREAINIAKGEGNGRRKYRASKKNRVYFFGGEGGLISGRDKRIMTDAFDEAAFSVILNDKEEEKLFNIKFLEDIINTLIENNEVLKSRMTNKQKQTYMDYLELGSYRKIVESRNNETIGAISQRLNSADFFTIQKNNIMIERLLGYYAMLKEVEA
ncbi:SatD family protein [Fonticella tunisiensis]|uniref:SatD family protein n=2 Tax=Fonticella tunisiensis TaxID=1096341 RepID=A0A4R7KS67_9CLOT|nr:SatD family protein [Fonticella tunisiensis]